MLKILETDFKNLFLKSEKARIKKKSSTFEQRISGKGFGKNADMKEGRFRLGHHLMPPVGWLNDPNGLCWYKGKYHVFFQYAPFDVEGGLKFWGHYTSVDLVDWKYEGTALYPDSPYDCHGVYSGSALVEDEVKSHIIVSL